MIQGNLELVEIVTTWAVAAPLVAGVVRIDERRLTTVALARTWPPVSRDAALFALWMFGFHPAYLLAYFLVHFVRTRGAARGTWLGVVWSCAVVGAEIGAQWSSEALVDALGL